MAVAKVPRMGWEIEGTCPECDRSTALTLQFAEGRMPQSGASELKALCKECGHVWRLPSAIGASRRAQ